MRLPLLISAIHLAQSVRLSASMKRHIRVERRAGVYGGNGDGGTNQNVHGAHQAAVEPVVAAVADEHAHGQTGKHGDIAVFADRRPTGHRAGTTDSR